MPKVKNEYDYTEEALERNNLIISDYSRIESNGIIKITYDITDRVQGMRNGTAVGAGAGIAVAVGGAALIAVFPPAGVTLAVCAVLGAPFTGTAVGGAVGAAVGSKNNKVHFFDGDSKVLLGDSRTEAAETADQKAVGFFKEGKFAEAKAWFRTAFAVCESDQEPQYKKKMTEAEAEDYNYQGEEKMKQGDHAEAKHLFELAIKAGEKYDEKHKFERNLTAAEAEIEKISAQKRQTEEIFLSGETLWNRAWARENEEDVENAEACFQKAESKFQAALKCAPDNEEYKKWSQISRCKIEGNRLFNEGTALQEEGNRRLEQKKFEEAYHKFYEAYNKYQEAKLKFTQGRDLGDSKRFAKCMDMAVGQVEKTKEYKNIAERMRFSASLSSVVENKNDEGSALADDIELIGARDA